MPVLTFIVETFDTPTGDMRAYSDEDGKLRILEWADHDHRMQTLARRHYGAEGYRLVDHDGDPSPARAAMERYFAGDIAAIDTLETATGGTDFQKAAWKALREIPAGTTWTYGEQAAHIGKPDAVRAIGMANGANPIGIVVPCHRVIGANGKLTGYGGGMNRKAWLLRHEGALADQGELLDA